MGLDICLNWGRHGGRPARRGWEGGEEGGRDHRDTRDHRDGGEKKRRRGAPLGGRGNGGIRVGWG